MPGSLLALPSRGPLRTAIPLRCRDDERWVEFTLTRILGAIDLLGEITGGGDYEDLLPHTIELKLFDVTCSCLGLRRLIEVKHAAGRPKDLEAIAELESLLEKKKTIDSVTQ